MSATVRRILTMTTGAGALVLTSLAPAGAASSSGANVDRYTGCENGTNVELCRSYHNVYNEVFTPSGNSISTFHNRSVENWTDSDGRTLHSESSSIGQWLFTEGAPQQYHGRGSSLSVDPYNGTCTSEWAYHYANGQMQYDTNEGRCN